MNAADRGLIVDLINQHGHLVDSGQLDRLGEVLAENVIYDVSDLGGGILVGLEALREATERLGDQNPVAHHVTNIVLDELDDDVVFAHSKGIGIAVDGSIGSVSYQDRVERRGVDWRIAHRIVRVRRRPLHP